VSDIEDSEQIFVHEATIEMFDTRATAASAVVHCVQMPRQTEPEQATAPSEPDSGAHIDNAFVVGSAIAARGHGTNVI
jgi:hypothetical protein